MRTLVQNARTIASPPAVYTRLMEVINHPHSSAEDIGQVISEDPSLTARLLRIANSSLYAFPRQIETVSRAVTIIGTAQLSDMALSTSVTRLFNQIPEDMVDLDSFWKHSVACGVVARALGQVRREPNVERLFIGGLLHDVGRAIIFIYSPGLARRALVSARYGGRPMYELERELFGFDHAELGNALLENWGLPPAHCAIVGRHHTPGAEAKFPIEAASAYVADLISNGLGLGSSGERLAPPFLPGVWDALQMDASVLPKLIGEVDHQIADMVAILAQE